MPSHVHRAKEMATLRFKGTRNSPWLAIHRLPEIKTHTYLLQFFTAEQFLSYPMVEVSHARVNGTDGKEHAYDFYRMNFYRPDVSNEKLASTE